MTAPLTDYQVLTACGHSPAKAQEIALDAQRGDPKAAMWVDQCRADLQRLRDTVAARVAS